MGGEERRSYDRPRCETDDGHHGRARELSGVAMRV